MRSVSGGSHAANDGPKTVGLADDAGGATAILRLIAEAVELAGEFIAELERLRGVYPDYDAALKAEERVVFGVRACSDAAETQSVRFCRRCCRAAVGGGEIPHAPSCAVGRLLDEAEAVLGLEGSVPEISREEVEVLKSAFDAGRHHALRPINAGHLDGDPRVRHEEGCDCACYACNRPCAACVCDGIRRRELARRMVPGAEAFTPPAGAVAAERVEQNHITGAPVRHIEYEVPEHPWASEEGCAHPAAPARVQTHEEAAAAHAGAFREGAL